VTREKKKTKARNKVKKQKNEAKETLSESQLVPWRLDVMRRICSIKRGGKKTYQGSKELLPLRLLIDYGVAHGP